MKTRTQPTFTDATEAEVQHAAYLLWIDNGRPEGSHAQHWMAAKEMLCQRHGHDRSQCVPEIAGLAPTGPSGRIRRA